MAPLSRHVPPRTLAATLTARVSPNPSSRSRRDSTTAICLLAVVLRQGEALSELARSRRARRCPQHTFSPSLSHTRPRQSFPASAEPPVAWPALLDHPLTLPTSASRLPQCAHHAGALVVFSRALPRRHGELGHRGHGAAAAVRPLRRAQTDRPSPVHHGPVDHASAISVHSAAMDRPSPEPPRGLSAGPPR